MSQNYSGNMEVEFHCASYTTVANSCLQDMTLSLDARGLLVTMFSLRHDWHYSVKGLTCMLPHGRDKIGSVLNELEDHGYVEREQYRDNKGHFQTKYHIYERSQIYNDDYSGTNPNRKDPKFFFEWLRKKKAGELTDECSDSTEEPEYTEKNDRNAFAGTANPLTVTPVTATPSTDKPTQLKTKELNTNQSKTEINYLKSINSRMETQNRTTAPLSQNHVDAIDMMDRKSEIREELNDRLDYDRLIHEYPKQKKLIDAIFRTMTDTLAHKEVGNIKISGCSYSHAELEEAFNELEYEHIVYVITCISQSGRAIKNPQNYILRCLLQANTRDIYEASRAERSGKNTFTQFEQNTYNFDELEELLLDN